MQSSPRILYSHQFIRVFYTRPYNRLLINLFELGSASKGRLGKYYPAYHCSHHGHYYRARKDEFEDKIMKFVERVTISPERFDEVAATIMQVWEQRQARVQDDTLLRSKKREEYEAEIHTIVVKMKIVSSPTALKFMEEDIAKLEQQIIDLETRDDEIESKEGVDMAKVLTYLRYFVEHMKDLLVDHCNPILRARYFGIIFDNVPSLADIDCGTTEIEKIPGVNELFKLAHSKDISLVHLCDLSWNQIVPSLRLMQSKLIDLGFEYYDGNIVINETEIEGSRYHEIF